MPETKAAATAAGNLEERRPFLWELFPSRESIEEIYERLSGSFIRDRRFRESAREIYTRGNFQVVLTSPPPDPPRPRSRTQNRADWRRHDDRFATLFPQLRFFHHEILRRSRRSRWPRRARPINWRIWSAKPIRRRPKNKK